MQMTHCWEDEGTYAANKYGFGSEQWADSVRHGGGTCMLLAGHEGEHKFTPDSEITVSVTK